MLSQDKQNLAIREWSQVGTCRDSAIQFYKRWLPQLTDEHIEQIIIKHEEEYKAGVNLFKSTPQASGIEQIVGKEYEQSVKERETLQQLERLGFKSKVVEERKRCYELQKHHPVEFE